MAKSKKEIFQAKFEWVDIKSVKLNPKNPRIIRDEKFQSLKKSIKDFPEMMEIRPIVVNKKMIVLGGNMRLRAAIEAGLKKVPVVVAALSPAKEKEFLIKDNLPGGEWDWDVLNADWDAERLEGWGLDVPGFESSDVDISDKLQESFKIEISCKDESHQEKLYNELIAKGLNCRLLSL